MTALLFALLFKVLPDLSIRWSDVAVSALVSALQLLFFGAEFTQVYARRYGSLRREM